ncbi:SIR2 family protein [Fusobacterium sp.]|uniref:SIR2 family protein n=1 Tax=Fusobacterium sp. TaxID=68766 RepID=UPI00260CAD34|nr:SIR2 family protein [Fusobacterium sp.]
MNFFEDIKLEKKFNLITANIYKELESFPSRIKLSDFILKSFNFSNINNLKIDSLFEVSQTFMDQVVCTKSNLLKKLQFVYEKKSFDLENINFLIDNNKISSIVNINYDNSFCNNPKAKKVTPFESVAFTVGKTKIYKPMGDLDTLDTCVITKQDFRKLKVLPFHKSYFDGIRYELKLRKNIILAFDQEDSDFFEILDFIFGDYPEALKDIYMVIKDEITDEKLLKFIKKYSIQILKYDSLEFLNKLVRSLKNEDEEIEKPIQVIEEKSEEESSQEEKLEEISIEKEEEKVEETTLKPQNLENKIENLKLLLSKRENEVKERLKIQDIKPQSENTRVIEESKEIVEMVQKKFDLSQDEVKKDLNNDLIEKIEEKIEVLETENIEKQDEVIEEVFQEEQEENNFVETEEEKIEEENKETEISEEIIKEEVKEEIVEEYNPKEVLVEENIKLETALENKYLSSGLDSFPISYSNLPENLDLSEVEIVGDAEMKIGEHTNNCFMKLLSTKDNSVSLLEIKSRELRLRFSIIYDTPGMFKVTNDYLQYEISSNITHGRAIVVFEMLESLFSGVPMEFLFKNLSGQISLNNPVELIKIKTALNLFRIAKSSGIKIQMNKLENIENIFYKINLEILLQDESYTTWCNYEIDRENINPQDSLTFKRVYKLDKKNIEETIVLKKPVAEKDIVDNKIIGKSKVCTVHLKKLRGEF